MPEENSKKGAASLLHMETNFIVMPRDANHYGNVHGGVIVQAADNLAYAVTAVYSRSNTVTARISEWNFVRPVKTGDCVFISADIVRVGNSSMDVAIAVTGERLVTGGRFDVADALFTMVAVDGSGKPVKVRHEGNSIA